MVVDHTWARKPAEEVGVEEAEDKEELEVSGEEEVEEMEENDVLKVTEEKAKSGDAGEVDPVESVLMPAVWRRSRNGKPRIIRLPHNPRRPVKFILL